MITESSFYLSQCKVKVDSEGKLASQWRKQKDVVSVATQCRSNCKFVASSLFASFVTDFTGNKDNKGTVNMACAYMNITEVDKVCHINTYFL